MSNPLLAFRRDDDFSFGGAARGLPPGVHLEFYGGGKGGSSTQTVSIPPEVLARYNAVNARAENVASTPFTPYSTDPNAFVADLTSSQKAGISNINAQQGAANQAVDAGQNLQMQGIGTAQTGQAQANAINQAALQGISQAQQQGTAYNQAAGKNIDNAMSSAAPYMQQMAGLTQAGLGQGQQYLGGATDLTQQAIQTGQQYANKAEPYYTGALQAGQPLNQQAQRYMQAGTQAVNPNALDYGQYMNPYMSDVVQAQQALQAQENAQQRSALQGKAIQSGAFGGDRAGIEQANLARQQSLANQATMANLLQSGYGQAQAAAQQQQGVGLGAAQANRAAQQAAAQQAAALGQQQYAQQLGVGTGLSALGQQQYGQALGTGSQLGTLGQQGYTQNLGAGAQMGQVGQNLYAQNIGQGQAIQGLGNQQFTQGLQGSQAASGIGQNIFGNAAQTAGIQQAGGMNTANLGMQNQAAQIAAAQAQMAAGQQQQQTQQAGKTALYNQFLQQQGYPFQIGQYLANIAEGTGALSGSTTSAQRTGQRGGRMGDGYASGGLVPDSQGGAVYEPGLYGRGGYADGGWTQTGFADNSNGEGSDEWTNSKTGERTTTDPIAAAAAAKEAAAAAKEAAAKVATTPANPNDYDSLIRNAYGQIGRKDIGTAANTIDQGGYDYWMNQLKSGQMSPDQFYSQFTAGAQAYNAANPTSNIAKLTQPSVQSNADYRSVSGLDPDIASAFKDATGKDVDPTSARKYQDMLNAGMSLDQIKYNIGHSTPALLKSGDVDALKGAPLTYNAGNFSKPVAPVQNQYGAYSAGDFETPAAQTPSWMNSYNNLRGGYGQPQGGGYGGGLGGYGQPQGYGNMSAMQGGYGGGLGGYGGGFGGYGQPSNYGMPNFGSSQQYGGAPDYAGAMQYGGMRAQYGMPQGYGMPPQATGKGAQPAPQQYNYQQQAPQATGKGAGSPQPASGKGASSMAGGGRAGFADGGRAGYAAGGGDPSSVLRGLISQYDPGDPQGLVARQAAMFAGAPGAGAAGYVPPSQGGAGQYKMLQPQASILPQQQSGAKEAIGMGTSIASLGEAGSKLYSKLSGPKTTGAQDVQAFFDKGDAASQAAKDASGGLNAPNSGFKIFGDNATNLGGLNPEVASLGTEMPDLTGGAADWSGLFAANGGRIGHNSGGRAGFGLGGIPGLDDLKQGYAGIPGNEGTDTPISQVIAGGTKTPTELKAEMDHMSSGAGGMGGSGGGMGSALGTAASVASLGSLAFKAGSWMMGLPIFAAGGRVGKAGGGSLVDPGNPQDQAMAKSFDNLLQRYDNNPLLAAAAMDVGTKVVDEAIQKAQQTGGDITDFLPRRTQEYMFALSKAAMGAHEAMSRPARAAGGRTGYALEGFADEPTGLAPAPSDAMSMGDFAGGLSPEPTVQVAGEPPTADKPKHSPRDIDYMARTLMAEAGNQGDQGMAAVGHVIKNRYDKGNFGPDIASIVTAPKQFSPWNPDAVGTKNDPRLIDPNSAAYKKASEMASGILGGSVANPLPEEHRGALNFANPKFSTASWVPDLVKSGNYAQLGEHVFGTSGAAPKGGLNPPSQAGEQKPVQTATATGLAPKSDAGPFETIGKKILPDAVPTDSSFWVPLIAGLGTMLASDKYRFSQRLGEGLVGGAAAYGKQQEFGLQQQKVGSELAKNSLGILNDRFMELPNGMFYDKLYGTQITPQQRASFASSLPGLSPMTGQAAAPSGNAPTTTKQEAAPKVEAPAAVAPATTEPSVAKPRVPDILAPLNEKTAKPTEMPKTPTTAAEALDLAENHPKVQEQYATAKKYDDQAREAQKEVDYYTKVKPWLPNAAANATRAQNDQQSAERKSAEAKARGEKLRDQYAAPDLKRIETTTTTTAAEAASTREVWTLDGDKILVPGDKYREIAEKGGGEYNGKPVLAGQSPWVEPMVKSWGKFREDGQKFMEDYQDNRYKLTALGDIYSKFQAGKGAEALSDLAGYAKRFGIKLPESMGDPAAGFDAAYKAATDQAFEQMKSSGASKAPATGLREALITSARPEADPAAVYKILTDKLAALDYSADMIQHVVKSGTRDVTNGVIDFQRNTKFNPYVENSRKEIPLPKGITEAGKDIVTPEKKPVVINGPDDIKDLERGTPFVIPYGPDKGKIGYAQ